MPQRKGHGVVLGDGWKHSPPRKPKTVGGSSFCKASPGRLWPARRVVGERFLKSLKGLTDDKENDIFSKLFLCSGVFSSVFAWFGSCPI